jgi:hypothetical protein
MPETHFDTFVRAIGAANDRRGVLGEERLEYPPREDYGYQATPKNALTFGSMGVDCVHYAILRIDGKIDDFSPVVQIAPMDFSEPYSLLANSFLEYLAVGCGVTTAEMQNIFELEREEKPSLVEFLKKRFDHSRLWESNRNRSIEEYRDSLELND